VSASGALVAPGWLTLVAQSGIRLLPTRMKDVDFDPDDPCIEFHGENSHSMSVGVCVLTRASSRWIRYQHIIGLTALVCGLRCGRRFAVD